MVYSQNVCTLCIICAIFPLTTKQSRKEDIFTLSEFVQWFESSFQIYDVEKKKQNKNRVSINSTHFQMIIA